MKPHKPLLVTAALLSALLASAAVLFYVRPEIMGWLFGFTPTDTRMDGIDVSHHNGNINWEDIAENENIQFVYIKATQGYGYTDPLFRHNIAEATRVGIETGVYHFFTAKHPAEKQFRHFWEVTGKSHGTLTPMIDVEAEGIKGMKKEKLQKELTIFCHLVEKHYGRQPIIYTTQKIYHTKLSPSFADNLLWIAAYGRSSPGAVLNHKPCNIWQFSDRGRVKGIRTPTDLNHFMGHTTLQSLRL